MIELLARHESLAELQEKMEEYIQSGTELGWLIDPFERNVYSYSPGVTVEILSNPRAVSGEPLLKGLVFDVESLWEQHKL